MSSYDDLFARFRDDPSSNANAVHDLNEPILHERQVVHVQENVLRTLESMFQQPTAQLPDFIRYASAGKRFGEVCHSLEVSEATYHRWQNQSGGMKAEEAKRLK